MKRILSMILTIAMVISMSASFAFAEGQTDGASPVLSDISGRVCEGAVTELVESGVISGYPDGSFRPDGEITRAEICTILFNSIPKDKSAIVKKAGEIFSDMKDAHWADTYVVWCSQAGLVKGYPDGTFRPDGNVTNNELITILVRAKGLADDAAMSWPSDYIEAAKGSDVTAGLDGADIDTDGSKPATRGNSAIMISNSGQLSAVVTGGGEVPADPEEPGVKPEVPAEPQPSEPAEDKDNILAKASGYAFGFVVSTGQGLNSKGDAVPMIVFNMLDKEYTLMAKSSSSVDVSAVGSNSALVRVQLSNGEMTAVDVIKKDTQKTKSADKILMTEADKAATDPGNALFCKVKKAGKTYITLDGKHNADINDSYIGVNTPVIVYTCEKDGSDYKYELGSMSDVGEGSYVIAYSIDKDSEQLADLIVVIDADDVSECLNDSGDTGSLK